MSRATSAPRKAQTGKTDTLKTERPDAEQNGHGRAECGPARNADDVGVGQGIPKQRLKRGPDCGQTSTNHKRQQHAGYAYLPENNVLGRFLRLPCRKRPLCQNPRDLRKGDRLSPESQTDHESYEGQRPNPPDAAIHFVGERVTTP